MHTHRNEHIHAHTYQKAKELCIHDEVDGNCSTFTVFSRNNPNQTFSIEAQSAKKRKEWVKQIMHLCFIVQSNEEEEYQQFVSL